MENRRRCGVAYGRVLTAVFTMCLLIGCGTNRSPYPEPKVKTALGTASTCAFCRKEIPHVEQSNMSHSQRRGLHRLRRQMRGQT